MTGLGWLLVGILAGYAINPAVGLVAAWRRRRDRDDSDEAGA